MKVRVTDTPNLSSIKSHILILVGPLVRPAKEEFGPQIPVFSFPGNPLEQSPTIPPQKQFRGAQLEATNPLAQLSRHGQKESQSPLQGGMLQSLIFPGKPHEARHLAATEGRS